MRCLRYGAPARQIDERRAPEVAPRSYWLSDVPDEEGDDDERWRAGQGRPKLRLSAWCPRVGVARGSLGVAQGHAGVQRSVDEGVAERVWPDRLVDPSRAGKASHDGR